MRPHLVVIFHVRQQHGTEVSLTEYNKLVNAFPAQMQQKPFKFELFRKCWVNSRYLLVVKQSQEAETEPQNGKDELRKSPFPRATYRGPHRISAVSFTGCSMARSHH